MALTGIADHLMITGTQQRGAADPGIGIGLDYRPAMLAGEALVKPNLILYRGLALQVSGIARVDGAASSRQTDAVPLSATLLVFFALGGRYVSEKSSILACPLSSVIC